MIDEAQYLQLKSRAARVVAAQSGTSGQKVGAYTPRSRRRRIERWHAKRKKLRAAALHGMGAKSKHQWRQSFASTRPRLNGRFLPLNNAAGNRVTPLDASNMTLVGGPNSQPDCLMGWCPPLSEQERAQRKRTRPTSPFTASSSSSDSDGNSGTGSQSIPIVTA